MAWRGWNRPGPAWKGLAPMQEQVSQNDPRRLVKTKTPGIYSRGNRYVVVVRNGGKQVKKSCRTMAEARTVKAELTADVARGEYRSESRQTVRDYFDTWIKTYTGRTGRGIRPETLEEYRRDLEAHVLPTLGRYKLGELTPQHVKRVATKLAESKAPNTVRLAIAPLRAMMATALEEGLIRSNPCTGIRLPQRVQADQEEERAKALSEDELRNLIEKVPKEHRLFVTLISHTGLRISEAVALQWQDLDFGKGQLLVKRRLYRGSLAPPKSRYGTRTIKLSRGMSQALWGLRKTARHTAEDDPIFATKTGTYVEPSNASRWFKKAAREAGVEWASFHTLRHTAASMAFRHGKNAAQVQRMLGHHSPAFTLATYIHLLPGDLADADYQDSVLPVPSDPRPENVIAHNVARAL